MRSMTFQNTNILATQVLEEVKAVKEDVLQVMEEQQLDENTYPKQHTNSATRDNIQVEILKLLQIMQGTLKDLKSDKVNHNNRNNNNNNSNRNKNSSNSNNSNNSNSSKNSNNSNRRPFGNGRTDTYCWICGVCNHKSVIFTRMTGTRIMQPWRTRCPILQGLVLEAEMEGQRC